MSEKNTCKFPRWEKIYHAKVLEEEIKELLPKRKFEAYTKTGILTYAILLGIFPGIPLFFTDFFMANFGQLMYLTLWSLVLQFPVACIAGAVINKLIIDKGWILFDKHKNIKNLNQTLEELRKNFPEIETKTLEEIQEKYDTKMQNLEQNLSRKTELENAEKPPRFSLRRNQKGDNPGIFHGPLSRRVDHRLHRDRVRRALNSSSRFGDGI